ncbi:MAG TPA: efflux RND transporter periplasmic adaptor subunit, partial [Gemmatimonadaceae bacterium]|nr:efflux RND transporter periplasmic adaptor subunit [Gemmatimonadaceae bacterium]
MKRFTPLIAITLAAACSTGKNKLPTVQTQTVQRRDITVSAEANGAIEPIVIVEVRSKASGMVTNMTVETGTFVKPGDLLVQVDTQTVQKQFRQAAADLNSAKAQLEVAVAQKQRSDEMLAAKVITPQENEQARLTYESARAGVVRQQANLDIAQQALEDATVRAVTTGTIIEKDVSVGQIIQSSTNSVSGGTTLLKMADLTHVRMRAFFNETDIGNIHAGEAATVTVDAFPDRRFLGKVEKIEPQAVVQQGVTMFPVLVNLENFDGALRPGMNAEVSAIIDQRIGVLAVSNDAIKTTREGVSVAPMLGLNPDTVQAQIRAQMSGAMGG